MFATPQQQTEVVYGSTSEYNDLPTEEEQVAGVAPLDTLPANWWNAMWGREAINNNYSVGDVTELWQEICNVLTAGGQTPTTRTAGATTSYNMLVNAIRKLQQAIATSSVPGSVLSSSSAKSVSVNSTTGEMLVNALDTYEGTHIQSDLDALSTAASNANDNAEGRMPKLSAAYNNPAASGTAIAFLDTISQTINGAVEVTKKTIATASASTIGSTSGNTFGSNAEGSATSMARSDHTHQVRISTAAASTTGASSGTTFGSNAAGSSGSLAKADHTHQVRISNGSQTARGVVLLGELGISTPSGNNILWITA